MRYFSSPGSPLQPMYSVEDTLTGGFPHSEIHGSKLTRSSPRLIAACHVLHRLLTPRHPPNALLALEHHHIRTPGPHATMFQQNRPASPDRQGRSPAELGQTLRTLKPTMSKTAPRGTGPSGKRMEHRKSLVAAITAPTERKVVGQGRLELPTSRLSSARSNQLSY